MSYTRFKAVKKSGESRRRSMDIPSPGKIEIKISVPTTTSATSASSVNPTSAVALDDSSDGDVSLTTVPC